MSFPLLLRRPYCDVLCWAGDCGYDDGAEGDDAVGF